MTERCKNAKKYNLGADPRTKKARTKWICKVTCMICRGSGLVQTCPDCHGAGLLPGSMKCSTCNTCGKVPAQATK